MCWSASQRIWCSRHSPKVGRSIPTIASHLYLEMPTCCIDYSALSPSNSSGAAATTSCRAERSECFDSSPTRVPHQSITAMRIKSACHRWVPVSAPHRPRRPHLLDCCAVQHAGLAGRSSVGGDGASGRLSADPPDEPAEPHDSASLREARGGP
jgi:hypothetical protein